MPLENEMKTPKSFGGNFGVLNRSMILIIFLYVGMGLFGYLKFGANIKGSITLNLPQNELYELVTKIEISNKTNIFKIQILLNLQACSASKRHASNRHIHNSWVSLLCCY